MIEHALETQLTEKQQHYSQVLASSKNYKLIFMSTEHFMLILNRFIYDYMNL